MSQEGSRPRRRWFQFSLRTMIVFVTIVALLLSWIIPSERQRLACEKLVATRGAYFFPGEKVDTRHLATGSRMYRAPDEISYTEHPWFHHYTNSVVEIFVTSNYSKIDFSTFRNLRKVTIGDLENMAVFQHQDYSTDMNHALRQMANSRSMQAVTILPTANSETFDALSQFPELESVVLASVDPSDHRVDKFTTLTNLRHLSLSTSSFSHSELAAMMNFKKLQSLDLDIDTANISALSRLKELTQLRELDLSIDEHVKVPEWLEAQACKFISQCHGLQELSLRGNEFGEDAAENLSQLKQLQKLSLFYDKILPKTFLQLSKLPRLETMELSRPDIESDLWSSEAEMKNVKTLTVERIYSHEEIPFLKVFPNLEHLGDVSITVPYPALTSIAQHQKIKTVNFTYPGPKSEVPIERIRKFVAKYKINDSPGIDLQTLFDNQ